ncbi:MAG TPA: hypothetical protein VKT81_20085 [Bryobacteraceae bacterium]|nr:hypothetical protein [Bryobacteraceae bacterium]
MIAIAIITVFSLGSLLAWFRYSCGLILSAKPAHDYTPQVAEANELGFLEVQHDLADASERRVLDTLRQKLERDYQLLSYLLDHSPAWHSGNDGFEQVMMTLDFKLMTAFYSGVSLLSCAGARRALREMSQVVCYFANTMGERGSLTSVTE